MALITVTDVYTSFIVTDITSNGVVFPTPIAEAVSILLELETEGALTRTLGPRIVISGTSTPSTTKSITSISTSTDSLATLGSTPTASSSVSKPPASQLASSPIPTSSTSNTDVPTSNTSSTSSIGLGLGLGLGLPLLLALFALGFLIGRRSLSRSSSRQEPGWGTYMREVRDGNGDDLEH
ncbi:hypothetical protein MMC10_005881 [Thelotrema lepadinum]|nr:hypothetical protein [Thelotrema lepadinum]